MLIDTHAHLDYPDFAPDFDAVLARSKEAGVTGIVSIGTRIDSSRRALGLAQKYPGVVHAAVGIHPCDVGSESLSQIPLLREMAKEKGVAAIGETGLDYYRLPGAKEAPEDPVLAAEIDEQVKKWQAEVFRAQLEIAAEAGLNVVIHQRGDCWADTLAVLKDFTGKLRGVFHCFGGSPAQAAEVIALGHLVSFTGIVTFKNAELVHQTARAVLLDQFMVETDCPYLAPVPHRGKRCEPAHTRLVAEKIAELRGIPLEELATATTKTARAFFRMG
ncbi:TatD DNase family protein [Verrucomicrobium sp. GAS474]|uniref:TatD family hydrolase n=1 Tax=Verrucomicrobium sp. GAS474 TaxID=1882831 RepID=UPI00087A8F80|nr:TatD family hydrolase [Verrucomicrobium sp. GAS474]SDU26476.1 TatD DNase family protein [Verrucomicrobium sp. GAS474]